MSCSLLFRGGLLWLLAFWLPLSLRAQVRQPDPVTDAWAFSSAVTNVFRAGPHLVLNGDFRIGQRDTTGAATGRWAYDIRTRVPLAGRTFHETVGADSAGKTASIGTPGDGLIVYRRGELLRLASDASIQDRWAIRAEGGISGMRLHGDTLFLIGDFTRLAGLERRGIAAVRMADRTVLPPAPRFFRAYLETATITDLRVAGNRLFVDGNYALVNGVPREGTLALDRQTGEVLPWQTEGGPVTTALFQPSGIVGCLKASPDTCGRYSYETGARLVPFSERVDVRGVAGDGWVARYEPRTMNPGNGIEIRDADNRVVKVFYGGEYPGYFRRGAKYDRYWVFVYVDYNPFAGRYRSNLYFMSPSDLDTLGTARFAQFGGAPEQFSILGHQVFASTNPAYVAPVDRPMALRPQVLFNTDQKRLDSLAWYAVCGNVSSASLRGGSVYYLGWIRKGFSARCSGPTYGLARLSAATGAVDPSFQPDLTGSGKTIVTVQGVEAVDGGVLLYGRGEFYQPDITRPRAGALARYSSSGQLASPLFGVLGGYPTVNSLALVGDSLVAVTGQFSSAGSADRSSFAVLRLSTGAATSVSSPFSPSFVGTKVLAQGRTAYVQGGPSGGSAQLWGIPLDGAPAWQVNCPGGFMGLWGQTGVPSGGRLLVRTQTAQVAALDPRTCDVVNFVNPDGTVFNRSVSTVFVEGSTVWVFADKMYRFTNPFPVASEEPEHPLAEATPRVRVWPNPARTSSVQVAGGAATMEREARAFDVLGREVWRAPLAAGASSATWAVASLSSGVYVVQVVEAASGRVVGSTRFVRAR